jgi:branched-chain amino acid transport system substrate-binding protein
MTTKQVSRRAVLKAGAVIAGGAVAMPFLARKGFAADPIKIGSVLDKTGPVGPTGEVIAPALDLAIEEINSAGGLLGRQLEVTLYDAQSDMQLYTQYAQQLALKDKVDVVFGGITSASREAIRPIFDRYKILYFYPPLYEGGVCDRNTFCGGTTPEQTINKLVPYALQNWGKKAYILAADYNNGQLDAKWIEKFLRDGGGSAVATEFFPLDVTDFSATISKIQSAAPDMVFSALVGGNHVGFYRQWASAGLNDKIPMASTTFGLGSELLTLDTQTTKGIVTCYGFYDTVDTPKAKAFVDAMRTKIGSQTTVIEPSSDMYEVIMLWAEAVKQAGTLDRDKLIGVLESGIAIEGPSGKVTLDPATHHTTRNVFLAKAVEREWQIVASYPDQPPADTAAVCDLIKNPDTNKQFEIEIQ